jgi:hypothetical protein
MQVNGKYSKMLANGRSCWIKQRGRRAVMAALLAVAAEEETMMQEQGLRTTPEVSLSMSLWSNMRLCSTLQFAGVSIL